METVVITTKKRKVDAECRAFKPSWTNDFFVVADKGVVLCLICNETLAVFKEYNIKRHYSTKHSSTFDSLTGQDRIDRVNLLKQSVGKLIKSPVKAEKDDSDSPTKISFLIAEAIAKSGKLFSDGEFVKECLGIFASVACPEKRSMVEKISLSHQTIARRVDDLSCNIQTSLVNRLHECEFYSLALDESTDVSDTARLVIFVRGVSKAFEIVEEMLDICPLKSMRTGQDIFEDIKGVLGKFKLPEDKLSGIVTDGSYEMTCDFNGFVNLMFESLPNEILVHHCIIHQEQLCTNTLEMKNMMEKVVSTVKFIRSKGQHHPPFQSFLTEIGSDHDDVIYFSQVPWLSRPDTLVKFWSLLGEIKSFMANKGKDVSFIDDLEWLNDLAFFVDMTKYLAELNMKLQEQDQLVNKLYEHVQAFIQKLELIQKQLVMKKVVYFPTLSTRRAETVNYERYFVLIGYLKDEFQHRFANIITHSEDLSVFSDPFATDAFTAHDKFQLELIGIQNDSNLKRAFVEHDLLTFYSKYISPEMYPNLSRHALRFISLFGSTYCCKKLYSRIKNLKTKSLLTGRHLSAIIRISTSSVQADIDSLCEHSRCQISH
ncbi:G patch domain and ankyrin repeat-containing protein 1 isoform X1 [Bombina bombina]|uniref:G patch domain and ankyrin repeat-containing protein 1 isoform X1 n=1 Tax=Bombina bombina TaxID=8345 RepID=UPI00235A8586|nr:G patch domain and ankyrin repeat-containing protein 1 isoform X1 [Bombina bombina]